MKRRKSVEAAATAWLFCAAGAAGQPLVATGDYAVDPIYTWQVPGIGPLGIVTPADTLAALAGRDVVTVGLPEERASAPLFTLPETIGGGSAFPGGFAVSDGATLLTGQTGPFTGKTFAGEVYLTPATGGATCAFPVNGVFDATVRDGAYAVSALHGPDGYGDSTGLYGGLYGGGLYLLEQRSACVSRADLLFDTGTWSGAVAADPGTGDLYFALGGDSATLAGGPAGYNDIWVIKQAHVLAALGPGVVPAMQADYVASIATGFADGINGMVFDVQGRLLVGLTDFTGSGIDRILRFDVDRTNPSDYQSTLWGMVVEGADAGVGIFDFVLDGATLRVTAVPEPAAGALLLFGTGWMRRGRRAPRGRRQTRFAWTRGDG